jgi:hypothetical protein
MRDKFFWAVSGFVVNNEDELLSLLPVQQEEGMVIIWWK